MKRRLKALWVGLLIAAMVTTASADLWTIEHNEIADHVNYFRYVSGLNQLPSHPALEAAAIAHSKEMATHQKMYHSPSVKLMSITSGWSVIGENVGAGPTVQSVVYAWFFSPSHRANLLDEWRYMGIGNYRAANGLVYVTLILMR